MYDKQMLLSPFLPYSPFLESEIFGSGKGKGVGPFRLMVLSPRGGPKNIIINC